MILPDINVLVPVFRAESPQHAATESWLRSVLENEQSVALADVVVSGFLRIVTNRRIYQDPATMADAIEFIDGLYRQKVVVPVSTGPGNWALLRRALTQAQATDNLVSDAHIVALAIEHGCKIATFDRDFARFPGLDFFDPLAI